MRKVTLFVLVFVVASLLAGCSTPASVSTPDPALQIASNEAVIKQAIAGTQTAMAAVVTTPTLTLTPEETPLPAATLAIATPTTALVALQLQTAEDVRDFGRVVGWVSGKDAEFVQGAQVSLSEDFVLTTLPSGGVFEFECVHYLVLNNEVVARPVCEGAMVRFDTNSIVPKNSTGTLWLANAVVGSDTEKWEEGFLNKPCVCSDGDCRDE